MEVDGVSIHTSVWHYDTYLLPSDSAWNKWLQFWLIWCFQSLFVDVLNQLLSIQGASGILVTCIATPLWWRKQVVLLYIMEALLVKIQHQIWVQRVSTCNSQFPPSTSGVGTAQSVKWLAVSWMSRVWFQEKADISLCHYIQTRYLAHLTSYKMVLGLEGGGGPEGSHFHLVSK